MSRPLTDSPRGPATDPHSPALPPRPAIAVALASTGDWLSGQQLAHTLGISRAAVSKHIRKLSQAGYRIDRAPRRGYRLRAVPDLLIPERILADPAVRRLCRGGVVHRMQTGSTNTDARALAAQGAPDGTLVTAEQQTAGKGRLGRTWISPFQCGIYASLILRPSIPLHRIPILTILTAVAAAEAVHAETGLTVRIKWPNDLLINERKFAGVLTEAASEIDTVDFVIVGLGMNVNAPPDALPVRPIYPATSIRMECGEAVDRVALLNRILNRFGVWYRRLPHAEALLQRWTDLSGMCGQIVRIRQEAETLTGTVDGINDDGALLLTGSDGGTTRVYCGDVLA